MPRAWVKNRAERDPRGWMFTFSDLVTLLFTFFVMMLAVRLPEVERLRQAFGAFTKVEASPHAMMPAPAAARELQRLLEGLQRPPAGKIGGAEALAPDQLDLPDAPEAAWPAGMQAGATVRREERGLVITLADDLLFEPGSAQVQARAREQIAKVAEVLKYFDAPVSVEGHTDDRPPLAGGPFADNWDLSLARAMAVLREMTDKDGLDPARPRVAALADTRPLAPNDTPTGRAANRRTEIVVMANGR